MNGKKRRYWKTDEGRQGADGPEVHQFIVSREGSGERQLLHIWAFFRLVRRKDESSL